MDELVHAARADATAPLRSPVLSWNEWDPLEEVIVGGSTAPRSHPHAAREPRHLPR